MSYLRGQIERVIHTSGTFCVLVFGVVEHSDVSVTKHTKASGHLFGLNQIMRGLVLELEGEWGTHPKYGRQFRIRGWRPWSRHTLDVQHFFRYAATVFDDLDLMERFVQRFGNDSYSALMDDRALEISNDTDGAMQEVQLKWRNVRGIAALADSLQQYELGHLLAAVFDKFGMRSVEVLAENPYRLVEVDGFSFARADKIAARQGIRASDPRRIAAAVLWTVREQCQQGHLFVKTADIVPLLSEMVHKTESAKFGAVNLDESVKQALDELERTGVVKLDHDVGVYLRDMYTYERGAARMLSNLLEPAKFELDVDEFVKQYEIGNGIVLSDLQREAVTRLITNRVLVVTGAPGTGKTTLIKAFVQLFKALGASFTLMAPTGIAAKRLAQVTGMAAQTVHRALHYDGFQWGLNEFCPLDTRAVIVDEMSMVDQELFYRLLDALDPSAMLVLVGDDAQLPSVGPGNVLRELLACSGVPSIRLERVFRQAESSDIVLAAHKIRKGESPLDLPVKESTEFNFKPCSSEAKIAEYIVQMAVKLKSRNANFQVLSPKYEGIVGVDNLNTVLRDALNPNIGQPVCDLLGFQVRVGDRLMVIKNNYKLNVYNGDIGKLIGIRGDKLLIRIHGIGSLPDTTVEIPRKDAPIMLKLAYAVTVHRCQGEEFETVIMPLVSSHGRMLQRNLFYTAVTRARTKVWVLGESDAVTRAVSNAKVQRRNTILRTLVRPMKRDVEALRSV